MWLGYSTLEGLQELFSPFEANGGIPCARLAPHEARNLDRLEGLHGSELTGRFPEADYDLLQDAAI